VWTYICSVECTGLEESDESEVSSNEEDSIRPRSGAATTATTRAMTVAATAMTAAARATKATTAATTAVAAAAARLVSRPHSFK
jgi:hypothetical protein